MSDLNSVFSVPLTNAPKKDVSEVLFVHDDHAAEFNANVQKADAALGDTIELFSPKLFGEESDEEYWDETDRYVARYRPYTVSDGILTVPVFGSLLNRVTYQIGTFATGYEYIRRAVRRGVADANVRGIVLHCDSYGGHAAGCFELVRDIRGMHGEKPIVSYVGDYAFSAGYAVATAGEEIVAAPSGSTGSVGVLIMHVDYSKMLADEGVKVTFIKAGERKVDGNAFEPLSERAQADFQQRVNKLYGQFTALVANNREMAESAVRDTEAATYDAEESVEIGFADRIGNMSAESFPQFGRTGETNMSTEDNSTDPIADARATERARFAAVQSSAEYEGREAAANHLLAETEMSADAIISALKVMPKQKAPETPPEGSAERNHFGEHMDRIGGAGVPGDMDADDAEEEAAALKDVHGLKKTVMGKAFPLDGKPAAAHSILAAHMAGGGRVKKRYAAKVGVPVDG